MNLMCKLLYENEVKNRVSIVREVVLVNYETRLQRMPFKFLDHVPTWDVSMFYHWKVEHPHRSRLELQIPCLAIMVYVVYSPFSSCGILTSIREVI